MKNITNFFVGVDVSKSFLDVHVYPKEQAFRVENTTAGIKQLIKKLARFNVEQIVCESSGGYENLLVKTFRTANYLIWQVEPNRIKSFIRSEGIKFKTDANDAKMLAMFASQKKSGYEFQRSFSKEDELLRELVKRKSELTKMIAEEKRRLKHPTRSYSISLIKKHINFLEKQFEKIQKEIDKLISDNDDWNNKAKIIESVPGIGRANSASLIAEMPELGKINNKKIAALLGVAPYIQQSGNFKGIAKVTGGRFESRNLIYMAALSASRCNPVYKEFYQRLKNKGKKPKVALVAVMRKMIVTLNVMIKKEQKWNFQNT